MQPFDSDISDIQPVHFRVLTDTSNLNRIASFVVGSYEPVVAVVISWGSRLLFPDDMVIFKPCISYSRVEPHYYPPLQHIDCTIFAQKTANRQCTGFLH